jgi:hypothetical protein
LGPAGFWTAYRPDDIVEKNSDQGPWGGSMWIHWAAASPSAFDLGEAVRFAEGNGWTCGEPETYPAARLSTWMHLGRPVFPLFFGEPDGGTIDAGNAEFPRHILHDSLIVRCETGWMRVAPGTGDSSPAYGYIQISAEGSLLAVYHLWGEA